MTQKCENRVKIIYYAKLSDFKWLLVTLHDLKFISQKSITRQGTIKYYAKLYFPSL